MTWKDPSNGYLPYPGADDKRRYFQPIRNSYFLAHHCFGSRAPLVTGNIYDLAQKVGLHDISLVGQILVHLRDPLEALRQVTLATQERIIITEGSFQSDAPMAVFLGGNGNFYSWWHLSDRFYRDFLPILGFEIESVTQAQYRCNNVQLCGDVDLWTFVARRRTASG